MKIYMNFDTGEVFTEDELRNLYGMYRDEMRHNTFEEYMDYMLLMGRDRTGGLVEMEEVAK